MVRIISPVRVIMWSSAFLNIYMRNIKKCGPKRQILPLKLFRTFFQAGIYNAGLFAFAQIVHCTERAKDMDTNSLKADRNVGVNILQSDDYFKVGKYEESYKILQPFEDVENAEVLWRLARSLYNMAKHSTVKQADKIQMIENAYKLIDRALKLDDQNYAVHKWMAILLDAKLTLEGIKARIKGLPDFKKHLMYAMELNPKDATTIYILGQYCYNIASMPWYQKKIAATLFATPPEATFEEALLYFNKAEEVEPNFYSLNLLMLGKTYLQLKKFEAARYWLNCARTYTIRTEEDKQVRKEAEELLQKYQTKFEGANTSFKGTKEQKNND